jgi:hypothetical protein
MAVKQDVKQEIGFQWRRCYGMLHSRVCVNEEIASQEPTNTANPDH